MNLHTITFQPDSISVRAESGTTVLQAQITAGLHPDAPCGGKGTCGKCKVIIEGTEVLVMLFISTSTPMVCFFISSICFATFAFMLISSV